MAHRRLLGLGLVVALLLAIVGTGGAIAFENNDTGCDNCHTEPEVTFVAALSEAETTNIAPTLAAYHGYGVGPTLPEGVAVGTTLARCIDCHSGAHPVFGRAESLVKAMADTAEFVTGTAEQPARLSEPLPDSHCTKCHTEADYKTEAGDFENHFHNLLDDPEAPPDLRCADCHLAHQPANDFEHFILRAPVFEACEQCHEAMGRGPTELQP